MNLTEAEREVLGLMADFWNALCRLPEEHPDDLLEARVHFHAIQNIVLARPAERELRLEELKRQ